MALGGAEAHDSSLVLLKDQKYAELERQMSRVQSDFDGGEISEIQLRDAYRPFYNLDDELIGNVEGWKLAFPASYAAHLVHGIWYKRRAVDARGGEYIQNTPASAIEKMLRFNAASRAELRKSLALTRKPYLSYFHLLGLSLMEGRPAEAANYLADGNKILPSNTLLRNRYMVSIEPRWGGSYTEMEKFIARSRSDGASTEGLMQLEAIMHEDMGHTLVAQGRTDEASKHFAIALQLAMKVRREFRQEFLKNASYYSCKLASLKEYCSASGT